MIGAGEAGLKLASDAGMDIDIEDMVVLDSPVALDGWGEADITLWSCWTAGNEVDVDRLFDGMGPCEEAVRPEGGAIVGADGLFFTEDDGWIVPGGAQPALAR